MMEASWVAEHRASGKMEHVWSFAGYAGGGGIMNVDTHEELDKSMAGFPFSGLQVPAGNEEIAGSSMVDVDWVLHAHR